MVQGFIKSASSKHSRNFRFSFRFERIFLILEIIFDHFVNQGEPRLTTAESEIQLFMEGSIPYHQLQLLVDLEIIKLLHCGNDTLKISKLLKRDHRTIQTFCNEGRKCRKKRNQPTFNKLTDRDLRKIKTEVKKAPYSTSRSIFEAAGLPKMSRTTRCQALKSIKKANKMTKRLKSIRKIG